MERHRGEGVIKAAESTRFCFFVFFVVFFTDEGVAGQAEANQTDWFLGGFQSSQVSVSDVHQKYKQLV